MSIEATRNNLLHVAVIEDNELAVRFLLKHGADVNSRMTSPLQMQRLTFESMDGSAVMGDIFCPRRSNSFSKCILMASPQPISVYQNYQLGERSLENLRNSSSLSLSSNVVELFKPLFNQNYHQQQYHQSQLKNPTALHVATASAKKEIIEQLFKYEADVNIQMEGYYSEYTPIVIAILCRRFDVVKMLLLQGADVNVQFKNGKTALHFAVKTKDTDLVRLLLRFGADMNARTEHGVSPLHVAVERKIYDIVSLLLKSGADVNAKTKTGVTPLQCAAVKGHCEMTEMILCYGGDVSCIMKKGEIDVTPLLWVTESERTKIIEILNKYKPTAVPTQSTGECRKFFKRMWKKISGKKSPTAQN